MIFFRPGEVQKLGDSYSIPGVGFSPFCPIAHATTKGAGAVATTRRPDPGQYLGLVFSVSGDPRDGVTDAFALRTIRGRAYA